MQKLNLPSYDLSLRNTPNGREVFDIVRRQWVALTPEEYVRQLILHYLVREKGFPEGLISVEHFFRLSTGKPFRADIVAFDKTMQPLLVIECKAPEVAINSDTLNQISRYNTLLRAKYLLVTNGLTHFGFATEDFTHYTALKEFPHYSSLLQ